MIRYSEYSPTRYDGHIPLGDGREAWLVFPWARNRDSDCLTESNFAVALERLGGESDDVEVHRFGHWGPGWYEIILVRPESRAADIAHGLENRLADYLVLDEDDFARREHEEAAEVWRHCYSPRDRIAYIRRRRYEFEFRSFADMLGCVRGEYFAGYASELLSR